MSGNGSDAGYAWGHMAGAVMDLPLGLLEYKFFLLPFEQLGHKYPTLSLSFLQNLAHRGRICTIRSQESMCRAVSCPGVPVTTQYSVTGWWAGQRCPLAAIQHQKDGHSS